MSRRRKLTNKSELIGAIANWLTEQQISHEMTNSTRRCDKFPRITIPCCYLPEVHIDLLDQDGHADGRMYVHYSSQVIPWHRIALTRPMQRGQYEDDRALHPEDPSFFDDLRRLIDNPPARNSRYAEDQEVGPFTIIEPIRTKRQRLAHAADSAADAAIDAAELANEIEALGRRAHRLARRAIAVADDAIYAANLVGAEAGTVEQTCDEQLIRCGLVYVPRKEARQ